MEQTRIAKFKKIIFMPISKSPIFGHLSVNFMEKGKFSTFDGLLFETNFSNTGSNTTFGERTMFYIYPILRFMHAKEFYSEGLKRGIQGDILKITPDNIMLLEFLNDLVEYEGQLGLEGHYNVWE
jgi:hypothetical protein